MRPRVFGLCALAYAGLVLAAFWRLWWPGEATMLSGDVATSYWQDAVFAIGSLREGTLPLWNPYERGGYPFVSDAQTACYAPLSWLTWALGLLSGSDGVWLQEFRQLATSGLAGLGMHLFCRQLGLRQPASAMAGVVMATGAFARRTIMMATYWPFAYVGFVLWAVELVVAKPSPRNTRILVITLLLLGTAAFPPSIFYALLIAVPYAIMRLIQTRSWRAGASMVLAAVVTSVALLVVVLPLAEQTELSWRANRGLGYVLSDPARLRDIVTLLRAEDHGKSLYVGLPAICVAFAALAALRDKRRRGLVILCVVIGALGFLLSVGGETPLLRLLAKYVPGFGLFRIAKRYGVLLHTAVAILAAVGLDTVLNWLQTRVRSRRTQVLAAVGWGAVGLNALDLQRYQPPGVYTTPFEVVDGGSVLGLVGEDRLYNEWGLGPRAGGLYRVRDWRGRSKDPMSFARYQKVEDNVAKDPGILRHFGVKWVLAGGRDQIPVRPRVRRPGRLGPRVAAGTYEVRGASPDAYFTSEVVRVKKGKALRRMRETDPGRAAFVEGSLPVDPTPGDPVEAELVRLSSTELEVAVDAPRAGIVVINEVWHPGWSATVDGEPTELLRVNHLVRGVVVGPGSHSIEMSFMPGSLPYAFPIFLLVILGAVVPIERFYPSSSSA